MYDGVPATAISAGWPAVATVVDDLARRVSTPAEADTNLREEPARRRPVGRRTYERGQSGVLRQLQRGRRGPTPVFRHAGRARGLRPSRRRLLTPEKWSAGEGFGTTAAEALRGETFEQRLAQEEPEIDPYAAQPEYVDGPEVGRDRAGRLVAPDEGAHFDLEEELVAADIGIDGGVASAEEAAIHVVDDEPLDLDEVS
jgi:hypothetical protein